MREVMMEENIIETSQAVKQNPIVTIAADRSIVLKYLWLVIFFYSNWVLFFHEVSGSLAAFFHRAVKRIDYYRFGSFDSAAVQIGRSGCVACQHKF